MVATSITGFMNAQQAHNEAGSSNGIPHMNGSNKGENIQAAAKANRPAQMVVQNSNNMDDMV